VAVRSRFQFAEGVFLRDASSPFETLETLKGEEGHFEAATTFHNNPSTVPESRDDRE
jgi:hypothetical protein